MADARDNTRFMSAHTEDAARTTSLQSESSSEAAATTAEGLSQSWQCGRGCGLRITSQLSTFAPYAIPGGLHRLESVGSGFDCTAKMGVNAPVLRIAADPARFPEQYCWVCVAALLQIKRWKSAVAFATNASFYRDGCDLSSINCSSSLRTHYYFKRSALTCGLTALLFRLT